MDIGSWRAGSGTVYFIAEAGVNHNGDVTTAKGLIDVAADANADAVKFQTFSADRLVVDSASTAEYQRDSTSEDSQRDLLTDLELSEAAHRELKTYCEERDIDFLSTPFGVESASFLHSLDVPAFKIGSGDLTNHPLLEHVADYGDPMIVSTGMSTLDEVNDAFRAIRNANSDVPLALLHCVSVYPTSIHEANLRATRTLDETFPVPVGFSDHTTAVETPALAVAAGAELVEKHFTLDRTMAGPDHEASLEPAELDRAVSLVRDAADALGDGTKEPVPAEAEIRSVARKGLYAATELDAHTTVAEEDIAIKRPPAGLDPTSYHEVVGKTLVRSVKRDEPLTADCLEGS
jgi:N-acetylneuraminate synthase/N,N'-diacetyllegionaminate synthase